MARYIHKVKFCLNFSIYQERYPWSGTVNWGDGTVLINVSVPNNGCFEHTYIDDAEYEIIIDIQNECSTYFIKGVVTKDKVEWEKPIVPNFNNPGGNIHGSGCTCGDHR